MGSCWAFSSERTHKQHTKSLSDDSPVFLLLNWKTLLEMRKNKEKSKERHFSTTLFQFTVTYIVQHNWRTKLQFKDEELTVTSTSP